MRFKTFTALLATLTACSTSNDATQEEPQTVQMKEHVQETVTPPPEPRPPAPPHVATPEEELALEIIDLQVGQPVQTESGMTIRMTAGAPSYRFEFSRGGEIETAQYSGTPLYIEGLAFGNLYTISRFGEGVQATLRSDAPRAPLPPATAFDIARQQRSSQLGCSGASEETIVEENGTAVLRVLDAQGNETCRIVVGLYTGQVVDL